MIEIKFRAWDGNKYWYFDGIFNNRPYKELSTFIQYESCKEYLSFICLEQFTGLYDRDGKEIYEGDTMSHPDFKESNLPITIKNGCTFLAGWDCIKTDITKGKIIGNIHGAQ